MNQQLLKAACALALEAQHYLNTGKGPQFLKQAIDNFNALAGPAAKDANCEAEFLYLSGGGPGPDAISAAIASAKASWKVFETTRKATRAELDAVYDQSLAQFRDVSQAYREAASDYRKKLITDAQYLTARKALTKAQADFDTVETQYIEAVNALAAPVE